MGYLVVWLLFGIFSAVIASNKNRSVVTWFLVGLFLGPFGLIVGLLEKIQVPLDKYEYSSLSPNIEGATVPNTDINIVYTIQVKDLEECWNQARQILLKHYNDKFPDKFTIKKNDKDELFATGYFQDYYKSQYYKMTPELRKDGEYIIIDALDNIDFSSVGKVFKDGMNSTKEEPNNIDNLMKVADLYKQGLLTDEEFESQKKKYL